MAPDWWNDFILWLYQAVPRNDWPEGDTYWEELGRDVGRSAPSSDVTLDNAKEAVRRLRLKGFPFPDALPKGLLEELQDVYRARAMVGAGVEAGSREECLAMSRDCPECGGMGLTSRVVEAPEGYPGGTYSVACYCHRCRMGRWMKAHKEANEKDVARRIVDLEARRDLWGPELPADAPTTMAELMERISARGIGRRVRDVPLPSPRRGGACEHRRTRRIGDQDVCPDCGMSWSLRPVDRQASINEQEQNADVVE